MTVNGYGMPLAPMPPSPSLVALPPALTPITPAPVMAADAWQAAPNPNAVGAQVQPSATHMDPNSFWPVGIALVSPVLALMGGAVGMVTGSMIGAGGAGLARGVGLGGSALGLLCAAGVLGHIVFGDMLKGQLPSWSDVSLALQCALVPGLTCLGVGLGLSIGAPWLAGFMGLFGSAIAYMAYFGLARRQP